MNASPTPSPTVSAGPASADEIDASCQAPLFLLWVGAAAWLIVASIFGLIASVKFHSPGFLADSAWLSFGRVHAVATNALLYGFALPAGLGVVLWIVARLAGSPLVNPLIICFGAKLWNLGVLVGLAGICIGDSTGFEHLEMPGYAAVFLFLGYLTIGVCTTLKFHRPGERGLEPAEWFFLAALFWFPWIFSTAHLLLTFHPVRGVTQAIVDWWYSNNLNFIWLGLVGLAVVFYFLPRLTGRSLHSRPLALLAFWTLILFGSWCGIPTSAPVPAWMPVMSSIAAVLTLLTLIAVGLNVYRTRRGAQAKEKPDASPRFIYFGVAMFLLAGVMRAVAGLPEVSRITNFTWFTAAQWHLTVYGFFAMTMFGAIYHIVPRVTGMDWPCAKSVRAHFWLGAIGILLLALPLAAGGIRQGIQLNSGVDFMVLTKTTLHFLRVGTLGEVLILIGNSLLVVNLAVLSVRYYRTRIVPVYAAATAELKPAEVKP